MKKYNRVRKWRKKIQKRHKKEIGKRMTVTHSIKNVILSPVKIMYNNEQVGVMHNFSYEVKKDAVRAHIPVLGGCELEVTVIYDYEPLVTEPMMNYKAELIEGNLKPIMRE
jgi:hypothetical protein